MHKPFEFNIVEIIKQYNSGNSAREIAKQNNTSAGVVMSALRKAGVKLRSLSESAKLRLQKHGHPSTGRVHSEETKQKLREAWELRKGRL